MIFERYLSEFLSYISSEKGLSLNTVSAYRRDLLLFRKFLSSSIAEVKEKELIDFLAMLRDQNYASSSIARILVSVKLFFRFLKQEGGISWDPSALLDSPRIWQLIPEVLTLEEIKALLQAAEPSEAIGARDRAILEVLYASGLRVSEVCRLNLFDVGESTLRIWGKGSKERIVPIGRFALEAVDHYLLHFRCLGPFWKEKGTDVLKEENSPLFVTAKGKRITRDLVWQRVKFYAKAAGLQKRISPHTLRHCFATHLLENGADLRVIQEMLGHATVATTDRYTQISQRHLWEAFDGLHPRP